MKSILVGILMLFGFNFAFAAEDHTPEMCVENTEYCLHLGFHERPVVNEPAKFMVHFLMDAGIAAELTDVQVEIVMDMGNGDSHGSAPVEIKKLDAVHYLASNAYFLMEGEWTIKVTFNHGGQSYEINVPYIIE